MMRFYDELRIGDRAEIGSHLFTAEDIKAFAGQFDPQPFHVDEEQGQRSHFGALVASGWHTASMWMRKLVDYRRREAEAMRSRGERIPWVGPSPGFRNMRWHRPVFVGDTVSYAYEVIAMRVSESKPDRGIVTVLASGQNQHGARVISFESLAFVERRDPTPP
ncbi:MaoC family dehydratase [Pseudorhodoplanes sp.]|jgi:acyl dehydratase|uniref:MaoC family dehydratase n=1 Tax=Pseudorhodoplanes sp. TaxID=1934341 RepID=UPI002C97101F|nr:MaoC family dehydratase [Pseudorhodoplanes sp.]HWV41106.1 MaoC family dehydratase [Pseudorhodoplanes sp.]